MSLKEIPQPEQLPKKISPEQFINKLLNSFEVVCSPNTLQQINSYIDAGKFPLIASNHQSHADGIPLALFTDHICHGKISKFFLPIAESMVSGDQSPELKKYLEMLSPICAAKGIEMIAVTRKKDIEKFGIKNRNFENLRRILHAHKDGIGLIALPEGSVQGGRRDKNGNLYGIIKSEEDNILDDMIPYYLENGVDIFVISVAINGSHGVCNPDTYEINFPVDKATITVSDTLYTNSDFICLSSKPTTLIMPTISSMLPIEARGIYK